MSAPEMDLKVPARVGVLGGGRMGAGIAHAFLLAGARVLVVERDDDAAAARERVHTDCSRSIERGKHPGPVEELTGRLSMSVTAEDFAGCGLAVEAVPEDFALKVKALRGVEEHLGAEGVASPADIDATMALGYKHPVGPLALTDIVGLDVRLGIAEHLARELGPRFEPPQLMRDMVERGELGRKSGRGFFDYS